MSQTAWCPEHERLEDILTLTNKRRGRPSIEDQIADALGAMVVKVLLDCGCRTNIAVDRNWGELVTGKD